MIEPLERRTFLKFGAALPLGLHALRAGAAEEDLATMVDGRWRSRDDHGGQDRLEVSERGPSAQVPDLLAKPHLGMHTKGG